MHLSLFSKQIKSSAALGMALAMGLFVMVPKANAELSKGDKEFMLAAAQGGMFEVKLGQIAVQNGMRQDVKDFGSQMVKDHTTLADSLKSVATLKGLALPDGPDKEHRKWLDKMSAKTGSKFDDAYISVMIKAHKKDLKAFKEEDAKTKDADLKAFLDWAIPTVQSHLTMIEGMKK